jgi:predicted amidophosphoribosyltransferase
MPITAKGFDDGDDGDGTATCPECNAEVYLIADRCPKCGYWFADDDRRAMRQGRNIQAELRFVKIASIVLVAAAVLAVGVVLALGMLR